jgi:hypothetical protein
MSNEPKTAISWRRFLQNVGISDTTGWRWRKLGWITPVNICGKLYLLPDEQQRFNSRAGAGEFARKPSGVAGRNLSPPNPESALADVSAG